MKKEAPYKDGDEVMVMTDRAELVPGVYRGAGGGMPRVEFDASAAKAMGYTKAGEYNVSARRLRAKEGKANAETAQT